MISDESSLPDDVKSLKKIIVNHQVTINLLEEKISLLQHNLFGRKSEKLPPNPDQPSLFDEAEEFSETPEAVTEITVPKHTRKKPGRKPLPVELPRVDEIHDISEEEKICACGCQLSRIGEDVSEKLDIIPEQIRVVRHIRYKYACKGCEGVESNEGAVKTASLPPQIIPQGIVTAGLVAYVATAKFVDAQPFYRQEKQFARIGVDISRATMSNWMIHVGKQCKPLIQLLHCEILSGPVVNIDETRVQVMNEPGRLNTSQSYIWVFLGGPREGPSIIYQYKPTRSGDVAKKFLASLEPLGRTKGYSGYVQTDAYAGYNALESPEIRLLGCWAHARRNFMDVVKATKKSGRKSGSTDVALGFIRNLYRIEKKVVEMKLEPDGIYRVRQEESKPILDKFFEWLNKRTIETPPKGLLGKAISYTLNNWERLIRYLENGLLLPDNNLVENAIRPFVLGRKNWLFSGHPRGAEASANLYSLIETAKANGLEPYRYLRFLFENLPYAKTEDDYRALLPQSLKTTDLANIRNLSI